MTRFISAHGATYTAETAAARITELEADNARYGASDGRVTEINSIREALAAAAPAPARGPRKLAPLASDADREYAATMNKRVRSAELELANTPRNTPGVGRIDYTDNATGRRRVARYNTRDGFLLSYIKFGSDSRRYELHFVDEN